MSAQAAGLAGASRELAPVWPWLFERFGLDGGPHDTLQALGLLQQHGWRVEPVMDGIEAVWRRADVAVLLLRCGDGAVLLPAPRRSAQRELVLPGARGASFDVSEQELRETWAGIALCLVAPLPAPSPMPVARAAVSDQVEPIVATQVQAPTRADAQPSSTFRTVAGLLGEGVDVASRLVTGLPQPPVAMLEAASLLRSALDRVPAAMDFLLTARRPEAPAPAVVSAPPIVAAPAPRRRPRPSQFGSLRPPVARLAVVADEALTLEAAEMTGTPPPFDDVPASSPLSAGR